MGTVSRTVDGVAKIAAFISGCATGIGFLALARCVAAYVGHRVSMEPASDHSDVVSYLPSLFVVLSFVTVFSLITFVTAIGLGRHDWRAYRAAQAILMALALTSTTIVFLFLTPKGVHLVNSVFPFGGSESRRPLFDVAMVLVIASCSTMALFWLRKAAVREVFGR